MLLITEEGVGVEVHTSGRRDGIHWMSHWELVDQMVSEGLLRREHLGPATYGACAYFIVEPCVEGESITTDGTYRLVPTTTVEPF